MKRTTNYGLNLFEGSDPVRYGPLNENFEKLDGELWQVAPAVGDIRLSFRDLEGASGGELLALDGRVIDVKEDYPALADVYALNHRLADGSMVLERAESQGESDPVSPGNRPLYVGGSYFFVTDTWGGSDTYDHWLGVIRADGTKSKLAYGNKDIWMVESAGQVVAFCNEGSKDVFNARVYDSDGTEVRVVQLHDAVTAVYDARVLASGRVLVLTNKGGWFSDDNFATHGACSGAPTGTSTNQKGCGEVGRRIYESGGKVYIPRIYGENVTLTTGNTVTVNRLTMYISGDNGATFTEGWTFAPEGEEAPEGVYAPYGVYSEVNQVLFHGGGCYALGALRGGTSVTNVNNTPVYAYTPWLRLWRLDGESGEVLAAGMDTVSRSVSFGEPAQLAGGRVWYPGYTAMTLYLGAAATTSDAVWADLESLTFGTWAGAGESVDWMIWLETPGVMLTAGMKAVDPWSGDTMALGGPQDDDGSEVCIPFLPDDGEMVRYQWHSSEGAVAAIDLSRRKLPEMDFGYIQAK